MVREQVSITGRDDVLTELRAALRMSARRGRLVVVSGEPGTGRTRLLEAAARRWLSRNVRVTQVRARRERYGVGAVIDALRADFDRFGGAELMDGISGLTRMHERGSKDGSASFTAVMAEYHRVFSTIGGTEPSAVFIDDVLEIADPVPLLLAVRRPACLVVVTLRTGTEPHQGASELLGMADEVLDLEPLRDEDVEAIAGEDLDESAHEALRAALGPLYGNPGTLLATLRTLRECGRIVRADGRCDALPNADIALPEDHDLVLRARRLGPLATRLLAVAASGAFHIDDLPLVAGVLGECLIECERAVDLLVEEGLLVGEEEWGSLRCACPALASALALRESDVVRRMAAAQAVDSGAGARPRSLPGSAGRSARSTARTRLWSAADTRLAGMVSSGLTNRQIASRLGLREKTVEGRLTKLFAKTGCRSRVELATVANAERRLNDAAAGRSAA